MLAARNPMESQIWRTKAATEVFPLVPVTATVRSGCLPKNRAAMRAKSWRGFVVSIISPEPL
jgi:hypothetical protein